MANKELIAEWIKLAKEDFELASYLVDEEIFYRAALWHLQQAVEKYTKAYLISKGWELRKIHDLEILFDEASKFHPAFKSHLDFGRELNAFYTESRYPPLDEEDPSSTEAKTLLKKTKEFIRMVEGLF